MAIPSLAQAAGSSREDNLDSLENLDIAAMRASLDQISDQIANVQDIDVQAIINQIEYVGKPFLCWGMRISAAPSPDQHLHRRPGDPGRKNPDHGGKWAGG